MVSAVLPQCHCSRGQVMEEATNNSGTQEDDVLGGKGSHLNALDSDCSSPWCKEIKFKTRQSSYINL